MQKTEAYGSEITIKKYILMKKKQLDFHFVLKMCQRKFIANIGFVLIK